MRSCEVPTNFCHIRLTVLTFIGYKRTSTGKGEGGKENSLKNLTIFERFPLTDIVQIELNNIDIFI